MKIAFWKYDIFPYVLSGEIEKELEDGLVRVVGYTGMVFQPFLILPAKSGKELQKKLQIAIFCHDTCIGAINDQYNAQMHDLLDSYNDK